MRFGDLHLLPHRAFVHYLQKRIPLNLRVERERERERDRSERERERER